MNHPFHEEDHQNFRDASCQASGAAAQNFLVEQLRACQTLGMGVPDMRRGIPEHLIIHMQRNNESAGSLLERAAEAATEFFKQTPQLLFVCLPGRGQSAYAFCPPPGVSLVKEVQSLSGCQSGATRAGFVAKLSVGPRRASS